MGSQGRCAHSFDHPACGRPWLSRVVPPVPRNLLVNQNLLYLVFKCMLNTKHSGWRPTPQVFSAHKIGAQKRHEKQRPAGLVAAYARCFHRQSTGLSTVWTADERHSLRCSFTTGAAVLHRITVADQVVANANNCFPAMATIRSLACGRCNASPVKPPKAGRIARRCPSTKHGNRSDCPARPARCTPGELMGGTSHD